MIKESKKVLRNPTPKPSFRYYFSKRFLHFLESNECYSSTEYLEEILDKEFSAVNNEFPGSFIDLGSRKDMISFISTDSIHRLFKESGAKIFNIWIAKQQDSSEFWKLNRTEIKVGRFFKKILSELNPDDSEIEEITNLYKSYIDSFVYKMEIVTGKDIIKYYARDYQDITNNGGSLNGSCMSYIKEDILPDKNNYCQLTDSLKFYSENENCGLLILKYKGSRKIRGRALIWTTTKGLKYIDVAYVDQDSDYSLYFKYAMDNNCLIESKLSASMEVASNDKIKKLFEDDDFEEPYLDTFEYNVKNNTIRYYH